MDDQMSGEPLDMTGTGWDLAKRQQDAEMARDEYLPVGERIPNANDIEALALLVGNLPGDPETIRMMLPSISPVIRTYCQQFRKPSEA